MKRKKVNYAASEKTENFKCLEIKSFLILFRRLTVFFGAINLMRI